jgi:hypothetical protein
VLVGRLGPTEVVRPLRKEQVSCWDWEEKSVRSQGKFASGSLLDSARVGAELYLGIRPGPQLGSWSMPGVSHSQLTEASLALPRTGRSCHPEVLCSSRSATSTCFHGPVCHIFLRNTVRLAGVHLRGLWFPLPLSLEITPVLVLGFPNI